MSNLVLTDPHYTRLEMVAVNFVHRDVPSAADVGAPPLGDVWIVNRGAAMTIFFVRMSDVAPLGFTLSGGALFDFVTVNKVWGIICPDVPRSFLVDWKSDSPVICVLANPARVILYGCPTEKDMIDLMDAANFANKHLSN